jgi:hypothetical protein
VQKSVCLTRLFGHPSSWFTLVLLISLLAWHILFSPYRQDSYVCVLTLPAYRTRGLNRAATQLRTRVTRKLCGQLPWRKIDGIQTIEGCRIYLTHNNVKALYALLGEMVKQVESNSDEGEGDGE